jgi:uncharacterized damage-inducible protein DinB
MSTMRTVRLVAPLLLAATLAAPDARAQGASARRAPSDFRSEFLMQFNSSMEKFVALAEAMPADKYAWSPGEGVMPVARVFAHVARYNYGYPSSNMGIAAPAGVGLDTLERMTDKAQVVALLRNSAQFVRSNVERMPSDQLARSTELYGRDVQQWAVLFQLLAHMNEHLGQSIAYARMNGIVPPWSR